MRKMTRRQVLAATATAIPAVGLLTRAVAPSSAAPRLPGGRPTPVFLLRRHRSQLHRSSLRAAHTGRFVRPRCPRYRSSPISGPAPRRCLGQRRKGSIAWDDGNLEPPAEKLQPAKPAELFRTALSAIHCDLSRRGTSFAELPTAAQDDYLASLEAGLPIPGVATAAFFDLLLLMTAEGFFATNSAGASHRDRLAWPLRGFPGAYASASAFGRRRAAPGKPAGDIP